MATNAHHEYAYTSEPQIEAGRLKRLSPLTADNAQAPTGGVDPLVFLAQQAAGLLGAEPSAGSEEGSPPGNVSPTLSATEGSDALSPETAPSDSYPPSASAPAGGSLGGSLPLSTFGQTEGPASNAAGQDSDLPPYTYNTAPQTATDEALRHWQAANSPNHIVYRAGPVENHSFVDYHRSNPTAEVANSEVLPTSRNGYAPPAYSALAAYGHQQTPSVGSDVAYGDPQALSNAPYGLGANGGYAEEPSPFIGTAANYPGLEPGPSDAPPATFVDYGSQQVSDPAQSEYSDPTQAWTIPFGGSDGGGSIYGLLPNQGAWQSAISDLLQQAIAGFGGGGGEGFAQGLAEVGAALDRAIATAV